MEGGTTAGDPDKLFNDFRADVKKRIDDFKGREKGTDEEATFDTTEEIPTGALFLRQANCCDKCIMFAAFICSFIMGGGMPGFSFFFGEMINGLAETAEGEMDTFKDGALLMFYLGFVMWAASWANVTLWAIFATRISYKTRMIYFAKCLDLDAAFYDEHNPNEFSSKIAKEVSAIQRGLGEKVGNTIMSVSMFFIGFALAFYYGWKFSLILCASIPFVMLSGVGMAMSLESGVNQMMRAYAQSAGYAEQALSAIRVVHSYGQEDLENENYKKYLDRAAKA